MSIRETLRISRKFFVSLVAIGTSLLIAGCGGGGASSGVSAVSYTLPTVNNTQLSISSTNANNISMDVMNGGGFALKGGAGGVSGVSVSGGGSTSMGQPLFDAVDSATALIVNGATGSQTAAGATVTATNSCIASGSITITADSNGSVLLQFNSCDNGTTTSNGALAATNVSVTQSGTGTPLTPPFNVTASYSYNLTFTDDSSGASIAEMGSFDAAYSDDGSGTLVTDISNGSMGVTTTDPTYGQFSIVLTNVTQQRSCTSYDATTYACLGILSVSGGYTVSSTISDGSVDVSVPSTSPLTINKGAGALYPYGGEIDVTGSGGSSLTINIVMDENGYTVTSPVPSYDYSFSYTDSGGTTTTGTGMWSSLAYS